MGEDLRTIKTQQNIQSHFLKLLETYNFKDITIKSLINECKINRSTFYRNYEDKYDLIYKITEDLNTHKPQVCYKHVFNKFLLNSIRNKEQTKIKKTVSADYGYSKQKNLLQNSKKISMLNLSFLISKKRMTLSHILSPY